VDREAGLRFAEEHRRERRQSENDDDQAHDEADPADDDPGLGQAGTLEGGIGLDVPYCPLAKDDPEQRSDDRKGEESGGGADDGGDGVALEPAQRAGGGSRRP
jgi:hypothetical protein